MGLDVWSPLQLKKEKGNLYVIIAMSNFYREVSNQLSDIGFKYWDEYCYWDEINAWHELCVSPYFDNCARFDIFD